MGGGIIYDLNFKGLFPYPFIGNNALQAGSGIEMILLSMAIAERVKYLFEQLNEASIRRQKQLSALTQQLVHTEERERRRIAGVLHDSIGQTLIATKWEVQRLMRECSSSADDDSNALVYLDSCIDETRSLTADLYPQALYEFGLECALESLADEFEKKFNLSVHVEGTYQKEELEEELKFVFYRAASELLTNVVKHAKASSAQIRMYDEAGRLQLDVEDDGVGFNHSPGGNGDENGFGLFSLQERLHRVGGGHWKWVDLIMVVPWSP